MGLRDFTLTRSERRDHAVVWWRLALWAVAGTLEIFQLALFVTGLRKATGREDLDFFIFLRSGARLLAGTPLYIYDTVRSGSGGSVAMVTLQHPAFSLVFAPLSLLPPAIAFGIWVALSAAAWALAVALVLREADPPRRYLPLLILLAATSPALLWDLGEGQVACTVALGVVAGWLLLRREHWLAAGVVIALVAALKPFLAPLALPLLWRGRGRAAAGLALGVAASTLAPLPWTGWRAFPDWVAALHGVIWLDAHGNLSVHAYMARLLGKTPPTWMVVTLVLVVVALGLAVLRRPIVGMEDAERWFGGLIAVGILASPLGWGNYALLLLPLWGTLLVSPLGPARRRIAIVAVICLWYPDLGLLPADLPSLIRSIGLVLCVVALAAPPRLPAHSRDQAPAVPVAQ